MPKTRAEFRYCKLCFQGKVRLQATFTSVLNTEVYNKKEFLSIRQKKKSFTLMVLFYFCLNVSTSY